MGIKGGDYIWGAIFGGEDFWGFSYRDAEYNLYILIDCFMHVTARGGRR